MKNIGILNPQETEIKLEMNEKSLHIPGYVLEIEMKTSLKRVARLH